MRYAVINIETKIVESVIEVTPANVQSLQAGLNAEIILAEEYPIQNLDVYNPDDGKFYRDSVEVSKIPSVAEQIQAVIDSYTLQLIEGGVI